MSLITAGYGLDEGLVTPRQELLNLELLRLPRRMKSFAAGAACRSWHTKHRPSADFCLLDERPLDLTDRTIQPLACM
jgi:hypothetical protein